MKELVIGGDPDALAIIPPKAAFAEDDWIDAPEIAAIGAALIEHYQCFQDVGLQGARIIYLFKKKGPESPRCLLGKCQRPSGLLARFSNADFIIWLAANNCRGLTAWQLEALVYHELKHASMKDGDPVIVPHEFEGFSAEIENYGLWKMDIERIAEACKAAQGNLFFESRPTDRKPANKTAVQ